MGRIKKYKEFISEELTADMPPKAPTEIHAEYEAPSNKYSTEDTYVFNPSEKGDDTLHRVTKSKSEMEKMTKYQHWTLDSTHVDTLYNIIKLKDPKVQVLADTLNFGVDGDLFLTGKFNLGSDVVDSVLTAIADITGNNGIITDFQIESSTDTEPIEMEYNGKTGNDALAQRRADALKDKLVEIGVDPSIISIEALPEQGPDLYKDKLSKEDRIEARVQTSQYRYVKLRIVYIDTTNISLPAEYDTLIKTKKTYYLSKPFTGGGQKPPKLKSHFRKTTINVPVNKVRRSKGRTDCEDFGQKGWWNDKKNPLGYD